MKLWQLRSITPVPDTAIGFIVRAETELSARRYASEDARAEVGFAWLDDKLTACEELTPAEGEAGVVIADLNAK
jgi:hypothetical protein